MFERLLNSIGLYTRKQYSEQAEFLMETNDKLMEMTSQCAESFVKKDELKKKCIDMSKQLNEANILVAETSRSYEMLVEENDELRISLKNEAARNSSLQKTIAEMKEQKINLINHINDLKATIAMQNDDPASVAMTGMKKAFDELSEAVDDMVKNPKPRKRKKTDAK